MSVLGLIMSFLPYLRSAMVRFPLINYEAVCRTAPASPGLLNSRDAMDNSRECQR